MLSSRRVNRSLTLSLGSIAVFLAACVATEPIVEPPYPVGAAPPPIYGAGAPPPDADQDGVADSEDRCPATLGSSSVTLYGCAMSGALGPIGSGGYSQGRAPASTTPGSSSAGGGYGSPARPAKRKPASDQSAGGALPVPVPAPPPPPPPDELPAANTGTSIEAVQQQLRRLPVEYNRFTAPISAKSPFKLKVATSYSISDRAELRRRAGLPPLAESSPSKVEAGSPGSAGGAESAELVIRERIRFIRAKLDCPPKLLRCTPLDESEVQGVDQDLMVWEWRIEALANTDASDVITVRFVGGSEATAVSETLLVLPDLKLQVSVADAQGFWLGKFNSLFGGITEAMKTLSAFLLAALGLFGAIKALKAKKSSG